MIDVDIIRDYVSPKIYRRGINYYNRNHIEKYHIKEIEDNIYQIKSVVSGTRNYKLESYIELINESEINLESSCSCPYDWEEFCKHEVAVFHKFFSEDYPQIERDYKSNKNYKKLFDLSQNYNQEQKDKLSYELKGMIDQSLRNFKLVLDSDQLTDFTLNDIVDGLNGEIYNLYYKDILKNNFYGDELELLEELSYLEKSRGRSDNSLLLSRDKENFKFLLKLIEKKEVLLTEIGEKAEKGQKLKPEILAEGNLDKVEFEIKAEDYPIYTSNDADFSWTVIDNKVHYLDLSGFDQLPGQIKIPEDKRGEFLFEVLPVLEKNIDLKIADNLKNYELIKEEPEVKMKLDYQNEQIIAQMDVKFAGAEYHNTELLGLDTDTNLYTQHQDNPRLWSSRDNKAFEKVINYLEDYNFMVRPDGFVIKEQNDIQHFITDGLLHIPEEWELESSGEFDEIEVREIELEPIIEVDDGEGINWFDFKVSYNLGGRTYSRQELLKMISYNKSGEAYVKIDNNFFVLESGEKEENLKQIIEHSEETGDDKFRSAYHNLLYYFNLAEEAGINFAGSRVYNQLKEDITEDKAVKEKELPGEVSDVLRDYQKNGYYWLNFLHKYHFGGILADDMGLGKTLQMLTLLKGLSPEQPALVVCPRTLIYNWQEEADKFFDDLSSLVYYGTPEERDEMRDDFSDYDLIITSYSILSRDLDKFNDQNLVFSLSILDEAQHIKNHKTKRAQAVKEITAEARLALTGTPLENSVAELWSIFDYLMPGYLGNYNYFNKNYLLPISKNNDQEKMKELKQRVAPFILRRRKEEVLKELPEKIINIHSVSMTQLQEDSYKLVLDEVKGKLLDTVNEKGFNRSRINVLAALTKLRQICNHPALVLDDKGLDSSSGKLDALLELVNDAVSSGRKIIVFSQFVKMLKLIKKSFDRQKINYQYLDGSTRNRMERVNQFNNDPEIKVFLISLKAGGVGLNLTSADMVIHVDPWWNPMVERQAADRAHRLGQQNRVMVYKLITRGTVEEKMLKLQKKKQNVFDNIIEDNVNPIEAITWEDIQELLEYK
ncbi:MAG: SNF2-related protein [Halanaerobium sp.]